MKKSREVCTKMTRRMEMKTKGAQNHPAEQNPSERTASMEELVAPKWRGPFEGYR